MGEKRMPIIRCSQCGNEVSLPEGTASGLCSRCGAALQFNPEPANAGASIVRKDLATEKQTVGNAAEAEEKACLPGKNAGAKKLRGRIGLAAAVLAVLAATVLLTVKVLLPNSRYRTALKLYEDGKF